MARAVVHVEDQSLHLADMRRRIKAIFLGSVGNLVEWYDFYVYTAFALYFAGSFFPITAMPGGLTAFARVLPLTHALALMRYGLVDRSGAGLHDIWGMSDTTVMAGLSLAVVVAFAALLCAVAVRSFTRSALH